MELLNYLRGSDLTLGKLLKDGFGLAGDTMSDHLVHLKATRTLAELLEMRRDIIKEIKEAAYYSKSISDATIDQLSVLRERINDLEK